MKLKFRNPFKKEKAPIKTATFILGLILSLLVLIIVFLGIIGWGIYGLNWQGSFIESVVSIVPYPAARVNSHFILCSDYFKDLNAARKFYDKQRSNNVVNLPNDQKLKKIILEDRLVEEVLIENIADRLNVIVAEIDADNKLNEIINNYGTKEDLEKYLLEWYGIGINDYKKYFIKPNLYEDFLEIKIIDDVSINGKAREKIDEAYAKLKSGIDFDKVFEEYSEFKEEDNGSTKSMTGNFLRGELPKPLEDSLFLLKAGQYTDVIKLPGSYSIIKLINKDEDKGLLILKTILVKTKNLNDLVQEEKEKSTIKIYAY
ncbi:peptidyl-prolyl cis-trans isomerase [Candidatus Falkowbacteria bacterium]|nr:peptidyl-prolyl cis-trans isomerase [Candidatus Falkowbacteria bacterium]